MGYTKRCDKKGRVLNAEEYQEKDVRKQKS